MKKAIAALISVVTFWVLVSTATAVERYVPTQDYPTIQSAIEAAEDGDTVIVAPGRYTGEGNCEIGFPDRAITIRSIEPTDLNIVAATIIDCNGTLDSPHCGFVFYSNEDANIVLAGLTITNGACGIICYESSPKIINCVINNNFDGGIHCYKSNPTISNCYLTGNSAALFGGAIRSEVSNPTITRCFISNNTAHSGGGIASLGCKINISDCIVTNNRAEKEVIGLGYREGGGIYLRSDAKITNCIIAGNSARRGGGICASSRAEITNCIFSANIARSGGAIFCTEWSYPIVTNCILWDNIALRGPEIVMSTVDFGSSLSISYSNLKNGIDGIVYDHNSGSVRLDWGTGNTNFDPCFAQPGFWADPNNTPNDPNDDVWVDGDYHLRNGSPCINTGDPNYTAEPNETDLDGLPRIINGRIDMGAYEFNHTPLANPGTSQTLEAQAPWGAIVHLDGSNSSDTDSTPGTNDDIVSFNWYEQIDPCDPSSNVLLGTSQTLDCNLPLGTHTIILEVTDNAGASDTDGVIITVQDTTPPQFTLSVTPTILWPLSKRMIKITPAWTVTDLCDPDPNVSLVNIQITESGRLIGTYPGSTDILVDPNGPINLRAWRSGNTADRIYTVTYQAADDSNNIAESSAIVTVPHDQRRLK